MPRPDKRFLIELDLDPLSFVLTIPETGKAYRMHLPQSKALDLASRLLAHLGVGVTVVPVTALAGQAEEEKKSVVEH